MQTRSSSLVRCCAAAALLCSTVSAVLAQVQVQMPAQVPVPLDRQGLAVIDNCVGAASLSFRPGVNGAMLDPKDGTEVAAAIVRRYPMIERDGLYPQGIALWRPPGGEWAYATLAQKAHAPHPACFTATVNAATVPLTPTLIRKYLAPAP